MRMTLLVAPSPLALQKLLEICFEYAGVCELKYVKKTVGMYIRPNGWKTYITYILGDRKLNFTNVKEYLGCIIGDNLSGKKDINWQFRLVNMSKKI